MAADARSAGSVAGPGGRGRPSDPAGRGRPSDPAGPAGPAGRGSPGDEAARELAVVLHDLAWLLPRTVGLGAARQDPLPASELEIMRLLVRRPGLSVNDVARELGMQPSNASTAIRSLISRGTLQRRPDTADARVVRLEPTPEAHVARDRREHAWGEALADVLTRLPAADRQRLAEAVPPLRLLATRLTGQA